MPNHVTHRVRLHGSRRDCKRFYEQFFRDGSFDFETVLPPTRMPKEANTRADRRRLWVLHSDRHVFAIRVPQMACPCINGDGFRAISRPPLMLKMADRKDPKGRVFGEYGGFSAYGKPGLSRGTSGASIIGERSRTHIKPRSCLRQVCVSDCVVSADSSVLAEMEAYAPNHSRCLLIRRIG